MSDATVAALIGLVPVVLHFLTGVFVRPRVPRSSWAKLGKAGEALDTTFGNYGTVWDAQETCPGCQKRATAAHKDAK